MYLDTIEKRRKGKRKMDLGTQVRKSEKQVREALDNLSTCISEINLKKFQQQDVTVEMKKYRKMVEKYQKGISTLRTSYKFLKTKKILTLEEMMEIEKELEEFENEFQKINKYVNID